MDKNSQIPIGDLSGRETELGVSSRQMVEQRAREIARFSDRNPDKYTDADWDQAEAELNGLATDSPSDITDETITSRVGDGTISADHGREIEAIALRDEESNEANMANRGVEEASHDQMVEASHSDQKAEG